MSLFLVRYLKRAIRPALLLLCTAAGITTLRADAVSDVVVGYTATWRVSVGGTDQANAAIYGHWGGANVIAWSSGSPHRMNVVGTKESAVDVTGMTDNEGMIGWMRDYNPNAADVRAYADTLGADLLAFMGNMADNGSAAQAEQPGRYSCYEEQYVYANIVAHETGGHNFGLDHGAGRLDPKTIMLHNYCTGGSNGFYTNPNIWLNGTRLLGEGSCLNYVAQGGDATFHAGIAAQGRADALDRLVYGSYLGNIQYRWKFNRTAGSTATTGTQVANLAAAIAPATIRGVGASFTGNGLLLPGNLTGNAPANSISAYIDLPNGIFSAMPSFTIEVWATPKSAKNWMRVVDIGRTVEAGDGLGAAGEYTGTPGSAAPGTTIASDNLMLTATIGTDLNQQRFETMLNGGSTQTANSTLTTTAGQLHHYAITFADTTTGGTIAWYRDGTLVATRDVVFHSASLEDVNNWLGRSMYSGDHMSHIEYHDVRIQNVALNKDQVMGNYRVGMFDQVSVMRSNDPGGGSGFFSGSWEFGATPIATRDYDTSLCRLLSPHNSANSTFGGKSLSVSGGSFYIKGTASKTVTVADLRLNGATIGSGLDNGATGTLAGNITVNDSVNFNQVRGETGPMILAATLAGTGRLMITENPVTLTATNTSYTGQILAGDGRWRSVLFISKEENLGGNPSSFTGDLLRMNRCILSGTQTLTIDDSNRGVYIGPSGGWFNPQVNTTMTIASPITSLQDANVVAGILYKDDSGKLVLTNPNNTHNGEIQVVLGELAINGSGRLNSGDHYMPVTVNGTLNYNSTATQTLRGAMSGIGSLTKNNTGTLNLNGANPFTGTVTVNAGTLYANPGNAATDRALSYASGITVNNGGTLKSGINGLFGYDGTQTKPITVNAGGTLTTDAANTDVNVGIVTLNGGTLAGFASTTWGSWRFKQASGAKLVVTDNSTVSAPNVSLGTDNPVEVASGKTLAFSGTITDLSSAGVSALTKEGAGTVIMTGTNTYSGPTAVNAGKLIVSGNNSAATGTLTVANGATLGGNGNLGGNVIVIAGGRHALAVAATPGAQVTRTIGGSLNLTAVGDTLDLTAASNPAPGSYTLATASGGISGAFDDTVVNMTGITGGSVGVVGNSLVLTVSNGSPYDAWATLKELTGSNNGAAMDPDLDGIANVLEFVLGGDPLVADTGKLPAITTTESDFVFTFGRTDESESEVSLYFQHGSDLSGWTEVAVPDTTTGQVAITENATSPDTVVIIISKDLANDGRLMGRLKGVK